MSKMKCPFCSELIKSDAQKCRYCGEWLKKISRTEKARKGECLGSAILIIGIFICFKNSGIGFVLILIGLIIFLYGRFQE